MRMASKNRRDIERWIRDEFGMTPEEARLHYVGQVKYYPFLDNGCEVDSVHNQYRLNYKVHSWMFFYNNSWVQIIINPVLKKVFRGKVYKYVYCRCVNQWCYDFYDSHEIKLNIQFFEWQPN